MNKFQKKLLYWLVLLAILSPMGILIPNLLNSGDAWGEWDKETVEKMVGFIPKGMENLSSFFKGLFSDYTNIFGEDSPLIIQILSYIISAILGSLVIYILIRLILKFYKTTSEAS